MTKAVYQALKGAFLRMDRVVGYWLRSLRYGKEPIQGNKVFFSTHQATYACNPKYITEHLLRNHPELDLVWVAKKEVACNPAAFGFPDQVRVVAKDTPEHFREQMTAKVWVDNALTCLWRRTPKRSGQYYLNTWHGSLGIKRLDIQAKSDSYWVEVARETDGVLDGMIVNSSFEENVFSGSFWPTCPKYYYGHARNDLLFDEYACLKVRDNLLADLGLDPGTRLVLYAPTFREGSDSFAMRLDVGSICAAFSQRFGGEWKMLVRLHPKERALASRFGDGCVDVTEYPDIQELMTAADAGITDYSSWIFDFALMGRPAFIFAYDLQNYMDGRGFYYPLQETPFPLARNVEELAEQVAQFDEELYLKRLDVFLKNKGCIEDGHACERIGKLVCDLLDS